MPHPHGLTPGWSAAELLKDRGILRRIIPRYQALSVWWFILHPAAAKRQLVGLAEYAFEAVQALDAERAKARVRRKQVTP